MRFLFDPVKRTANLKKHGYDLKEAKVVIETGQTATFEDDRFDFGEARFVTMGQLADEVVVIVTAETDEEIRVISMRKADKHEQKIFFKYS